MKIQQAITLVSDIIKAIETDAIVPPCEEKDILPAFKSLLIRNEKIAEIAADLRGRSFGSTLDIADQLDALTEPVTLLDRYLDAQNEMANARQAFHLAFTAKVAAHLDLDIDQMHEIDYVMYDDSVRVDYEYNGRAFGNHFPLEFFQ